LLHGDSVALVSDAGTPAIADPGYRLVVGALLAGIQVTPIPGAAALAAVISASGLPSDRFVFEGFLPAKSQGKKKKLQKLQSEVRTLIFYEAPHRLKESLQDLQQVFGDREIVVAREVTKMHEEFLRGTISAVSEQIANRELKGEITIVVQGSPSVAEVSDEEIEAEIRRLAGAGMGIKAISQLLGERYDLSKRGLYRLALDLMQAKETD